MIRIIYEGTRYDKQATKMLSDSGLFDEETSKNIVDALFREDIHAFVHSPNWLEKYLKGIVRMMLEYSNGDRDKALEFLNECPPVFDRYLTWVKQNREKVGNSLDTEFVQKMSYQDVKDKLEEIQTELDKQSQDELSKMDFSGSSNYELIPIESYSEFHKLFGGAATGDGSSDAYAGSGGTAWCHANSQSTYDSWVSNGNNQFFVLANKDWKDIPFDKESNDKNPKDAYGTSLIALLVNKTFGILLNATLRCNHIGVETDADNQYDTYAELSRVAGFNVEDAIKNVLDIENVELVNPSDIFDGSANSLDKFCQIMGTKPENLRSFDIPDTVTEIGDSAFAQCENLYSINIPDSVTKIGNLAFGSCTMLTSVNIPDSVTEIGKYAFEYCTGLAQIHLPERLSKFEECLFYQCEWLKSFNFPKSLRVIGERTFYYCTSLTSIQIPDSVKTIEPEAFIGCASIVDLKLPNDLTVVDDGTFLYCESLTSITIPDNVTTIGNSAFAKCTSLTSIKIPNSVNYIGKDAFSNCPVTIETSNPYVIEYCIENNIRYK